MSIRSKAVDITLLGDKKLQAKLRKLEGAVQRKIVKRACKEAARPVLAASQRLVPVKTGKLKASLKLASASGRRGEFGYSVVTGTRPELGIDPSDKHYYPAAVEFGHDNAPAHSFLRAGMDEQRENAKRIMREEIAAGIRAVARG